MIVRDIKEHILNRGDTKKAIILLGPRQTGKTTLLTEIATEKGNHIILDCDDPIVREQLTNANTEQLKLLIGNHKVVFIDEAQRVMNIGVTLKIIIDRIQDVYLLVSGSSALDLASEVNEPLTGRKWEYRLYPISWNEFYKHKGHLQSAQLLEHRLIYGMYPDVINNPSEEKDTLKELSKSYLYKDLLAVGDIRKPEELEKLLMALALQIGSEVSYNELAQTIQIDKNTVGNYIDILEKAFVIFRLPAFSKNVRNEIKKSKKVYFYDNGIRNAIISDFKPLNLRNDKGALWENFLLSERMKYLNYNRLDTTMKFWRTTIGQEIDYVEEIEGRIFAYEFKWNPAKAKKFSKTFTENYPDAQLETIHHENYLKFITMTDDN